MTQGMWIGGRLPASMPLFYACHLITQPLPSLYFPARVICGGGVTILSYSSYFVGDRENIPDYGRARCSAGNKLDPQPETSWILSWKQARFRVTDR